MSLKKLENLTSYNFYQQDIDNLSWWIYSRKKNTLLFLNPLQFSIDFSLPIERAIDLFLVCAIEKDVKIFDVKSILKCGFCDNTIHTEFNNIEFVGPLPSKCSNCGCPLNKTLIEDGHELYFELTVDPFPKPSALITEPNRALDTKIPPPLTPKKLKGNLTTNGTDLIRRLRG